MSREKRKAKKEAEKRLSTRQFIGAKEINLIRYPQRGVCLYKCGNERYNLMVNAPEHKARLFGKAGGR